MPWTLDGRVSAGDVNVLGGKSLSILDPIFAPRLEAQTSNVTINTTDTSLFSFSATNGGVIQALAVNFSKNNVEVVLKIDAVELFRLDLGALSDVSEFGLGDRSLTGDFPIRTGVSSDQMIVDFSGTPAGFASSFEVLAKRSAGPMTMRSLLCLYRERTSA